VRRRVRFGVRSETETTSYSVVQVPQADKRFGSGPVLSDYVVTTELVRSQVRPLKKALETAPFCCDGPCGFRADWCSCKVSAKLARSDSSQTVRIGLNEGSSWWRVRRGFLWRALKRGLDPYVRIYGSLAAIFNFGVLAVVGWGWHRPRLAVELFALGVVLIVTEGAYRLLRDAEQEAERLRDAFDERLRPRLTLTVDREHINHFADGTGAGKYATVMVEASEAVTGCRASITRIVTNGNEVVLRGRISLRWIRETNLAIDIDPSFAPQFGVVFTESVRPGEVMIQTDSHEAHGVPWEIAHGDSIITVVVLGDGIPSAEATLRVSADDDWTHLQADAIDAPPREPDPYPVSRYMGLHPGGTAPYDEAREQQLRQQLEGVPNPPTHGGTINYPG
jgi:hypothetical protein